MVKVCPSYRLTPLLVPNQRFPSRSKMVILTLLDASPSSVVKMGYLLAVITADAVGLEFTIAEPEVSVLVLKGR